jgi:hypothetical protein
MRLEPDFKPASELSVEDITAIVAVGRRQAEIMNQLEEALIADDVAQVVALARRLVNEECSPPEAAAA